MSAVTQPGYMQRAIRLLRPSHEHSAFSATLLLMSVIMLSRVIGYVRDAYIAWAFGAGPQTDAYVAAFTVPDFLMYLLAGGATSITFISIYTRYTAENREREAQQTLSIIITVMAAAFAIGGVAAGIFAPQIVRLMFHKFGPDEVRLCVHLTRILLPQPLVFFIGGVIAAVLLSKRMFLIPSLTSIVYTVSIIAGGILLSGRVGIASLALGATAGAFIGPFLMNAVVAARNGLHFSPSFNVKNGAFREWLWMTIPLMLGVSLVTADDWLLRYFASGGAGDITRLNYAKRLLQVPVAVMAQAAGQAALPFFAKLFSEKRLKEFADQVNGSVYRVAAVSFLITALMMATALPITDLAMRRGKFTFFDAQETAGFLFWFALSLAFWSAQAIYARGFYGAENTWTPMIAGTSVTVLVIPVYYALFQSMGAAGLAIASDIGIVTHTVVLAVLLHRRRLVSLNLLPWGELAKALVTAVLAGLLAFKAASVIPLEGRRMSDIQSFLLAAVVWGATVALGLWITKSDLLSALRPKKLPSK
jgi:putative peptidoglycan lipid II flippase